MHRGNGPTWFKMGLPHTSLYDEASENDAVELHFSRTGRGLISVLIHDFQPFKTARKSSFPSGVLGHARRLSSEDSEK